MIEGQEVMGRTKSPISVAGQPTNAVLAQACMGVFFVRSVSNTIFVRLFLPKPPADRSEPPNDHWSSADHSLRNDVLGYALNLITL
jgi:hypothetical protein